MVGVAVAVSPWWWTAAVPPSMLGVIGVWDLTQRQHSVLRNCPVLVHARFPLERIRPELRQYFVERNFDRRPFDRDIRSIVYERAKDTAAEEPFGTERDVYQADCEYLVPSMAPRPVPEHPPRVRIGGPASPASASPTQPTTTTRTLRRRHPGPILRDVLTNPDEIAVLAKPTVEQGWGSTDHMCRCSDSSCCLSKRQKLRTAQP
ncbi:glutamate synthase domain-containing protein 2 [Streptomyces turgidiscabies]|uniref:Glutamate synthase domain-containing protein 2 n=1 Tax=Streptomyces turgidiscabies TaxID=85558 RepID=A0ABU0S053_9ACTN|nr:glutamate synthase domain-containing protein 2 [Streptomyces turgidiscabies]